MDEQSVKYYRAMLFAGNEDLEQIPKSLVVLHNFVAKRQGAMGLGHQMSKQMALIVVLTWLSSTTEGKEFARANTLLGDVFDDKEEEDVTEETKLTYPLGTPVKVVDKDENQLDGEFIGQNGAWLYVMIDGQKKSFRPHQVTPIGA